MSATLLPLWLLTVACACAGAIICARRARRDSSSPASRAMLLAIPAIAVIMAVLAVLVLAIAPTVDGAAGLKNKTSEGESARAPAKARLFLRQVRIENSLGRIGYSPDASVVLPSLYNLPEAGKAWDLLELKRNGDALTLGERERPEPTTTRIQVTASNTAFENAALRNLARSCRTRQDKQAAPVTGSFVAAALCSGTTPRAVIAFEAHAGAVLLSARVWRRGRLEPHHIEIEPEALIQIGASGSAVPGVTMWEVPAPAGRSELFAAPTDLLGPCSRFSSSVYSGARASSTHDTDGAICVIPFAPPFALEVRRLRPDVAGVTSRGVWTAALLMFPLLGWGIALLARRRSETRRADTVDLLRFAIISVGAIALFSARLIWSHRIDMLRDWEVSGVRIEGNLVLVVAVFAALSMHACLSVLRGRSRAAIHGLLVFALAAVVGWLTAPTVFGFPSGRALAQFAVALALGSLTIWKPLASKLFDESPHRVVLAIAAASLTTHLIAPRAVAVKLVLASVAIVAGYRVLRDALGGERENQSQRLIIGLATTFAMLLSLVVLDTGLAMVIAVPGFMIALALAGHDALFGAAALTEVKSYRLRQAPLLWLQGGLIASLVLAIAVWAGVGLASGDNPKLARELTLGAPNLLWVIAALFAAPALVAHRRGDRRTAALFGSAAALAVGGWLFRETLSELVLSSSAPAAQRYAVIADPGYALLADPRAFLSGITGWAETIFASNESAFGGAGFFAAQLIDPGVLLSVENDYLPILILRELGILGMTVWAITSLALLTTAWLVGREMTSIAGAESRGRLAVAAVVLLAVIYQPLASLGALPLTGVSWLGLGIDSPSDLWLMLGVVGYLLAIGSTANDVRDSRHESALRATRRFRRKERWVAAATGLATIAGILLIARTSAFAVNRPMPVATSGEASAPFVGLEAAIDYTRTLRCSTREDGVLELTGAPSDRGTRRYHKRLTETLGAGKLAVGDELRVGLVTIKVRDAGEAVNPSCDVVLEQRALRALRVTPTRPYKKSRVRLVSVPMGRAAGDHGELIAGDIAIRLRASAEPLELPRAPGIYAGKSVALGDDVVVATSSAGAVTLEDRGTADRRDHWLFIESSGGSGVGVRETQDGAHWTPVNEFGPARPIELNRDALIVVGRGITRNVWLFRAPRRDPTNPLDSSTGVNVLLADDARSVTGSRRRLYVYGNDLPELGWVNPYRMRGSVGLDGWVHAALAQWSPNAPADTPSCGTLAPPQTEMSNVCTAKPGDDAIECRISLQPELAIRMRHLTEMIAAAPTDFTSAAAADQHPRPLRASFTLLRGDTGEIAAQGSFVPGRASAAYAPTTAALETHLIRLREDRDPKTGARLPPSAGGEASAEKSEHDRPLAVGSIVKPMLARAFEQTAPALSRRLMLSGAPTEGASCRGGRAHAIFGHCPPTDSLWNQRRLLSMRGFLSHSANWYLAAIALLGTSLPAGEAGFGQGPALDFDELTARGVGDHEPEWALWTKLGGNTIVSSEGNVAIDALRTSDMWRRFEALLGRPLCASGNKFECAARSSRRDTCAVRGLAVTSPTSDLRQLVSLGPDRFDFYPRQKDRERRLEKVPVREYLQFLRGSGVHPIGSLAQLTDAFNRVIYEANRDPLRDGPYQLAATWFPGPVVGEIPETHCRAASGGDTAASGLCEVVRSGTAARALNPLVSDRRIEIYGAKTGTVDSLGDVASRKKQCERFRQAHTLNDRPRAAESQPYWLECGRLGEVDDSLLVISFAVITSSGGRVPLTLGLAFQRSGSGLAARVAVHYIDAIADYFAAGEKGQP